MTADELAHRLLALTPSPSQGLDPGALLDEVTAVIEARSALLANVGDGVIGRASAEIAAQLHARDEEWQAALQQAREELGAARCATGKLAAYSSGSGTL